MSDFKTIDGLMRHLRENGVDIHNSKQKRQLINTGYYHGYKGYRFFKRSSIRLPISSYQEINAIIQYDAKLKSLLYGKVMFLETALKNVVLISIMSAIKSSKISELFRIGVSSYKNSDTSIQANQKKKFQENKLNLQVMIQNSIYQEYKKGNPKITHFYDNSKHNDVPLWALFEILTMGNFGYLVSCLTVSIREKISKELGLNLSCDTNRTLLQTYIYLLKELRNAIAHNEVVYDTRFKNYDAPKSAKTCLEQEFTLKNIHFNSIVDYIILITYILKLLKVPKTELKSFIRDFENISKEYQLSVDDAVCAITKQSELNAKLEILKNSI